MVEEGAGGGADVVAALGVPLDAEEELGAVDAGGAPGGVVFYGFDYAVVRAASYDAEAVAGRGDGLVVASIDRETEETVGRGGFHRVKD